MRTRIVGIDCAVDEKHIGIAAGDLDHANLVIHTAMQCGVRSAADLACEFLADAERALIALDAPLGWPEPLGRTLAAHRAGAPMRAAGHTLFRRRTDIVVKSKTGQQPLDVGADRIARTALAALTLLEAIRERIRKPIPLAWSPSDADVCAIEVYPAATLKRIGVSPRSYKNREQSAARAAILETLGKHADVSSVRAADSGRADALDAVVCVLAGADFLLSRCIAPSADERSVAEREGWIWFRASCG